jgi:hypothetical protein
LLIYVINVVVICKKNQILFISHKQKTNTKNVCNLFHFRMSLGF